MSKINFFCLVLCSLLLFMADNSIGDVKKTSAINEPPKETKLSPTKPEIIKATKSKHNFQVNSNKKYKETNILNTGKQHVFDFDLDKFDQKMNEFDHVIAPASQQSELPKELIAAVIQVESNWDTQAKSKNGAKGMMQLKKAAQKETNVQNPYNAEQNIKGGAEYLKKMCDEFDSIELGVIAYKIGPTKLKILKSQKDTKIPQSALKYAQGIIYLTKNG